MNVIEEFFKNRVSFTTAPHAYPYTSINSFKPDCYYLYSTLDEKKKKKNWHNIEILICAAELIDGMFYDVEKITLLTNSASWDKDIFLWNFEHMFDSVKSKFCYASPSKPFEFYLYISRPFNIEEESEEEEKEEEDEEPVINTYKTFKSDECVTCLTNPSNVLFCNCGHLCLCVECDEERSLEKCPICKTKND